MRVSRLSSALFAVALALAPARAHAEMRISDLDVFLNDQDVTVHVVLLDALSPAFDESIRSGIPAHVRVTVELWQYNRYWRDRLLATRTIERQLEYNVVTKEFRIASGRGDPASTYVTREMRDAQRVLSELDGIKLASASTLEPAEIFYVRVHAESALRGQNTLLTRIAGTAEQTFRRSDYRTLMRVE